METMISQEALAFFLAASFLGALLSFVGTTKTILDIEIKNHTRSSYRKLLDYLVGDVFLLDTHLLKQEDKKHVF